MKSKQIKYNFLISLLFIIITGCSGPNDEGQKQATNNINPLPSWNECTSKAAIMDYVNDVTNPASKNFIPVAERIATFDNDGTLWSEQPMYFQLFFTLDRIKAMAPDHPEWKDQQPFKAVLENNMGELTKQGEHGLVELVMASHPGSSTDEFEKIVLNWITNARHPRFDKPFTELVYQPMLELLQYLRQNKFKTFIVSGGGLEFMRPWTEAVYGIPPEQVIGSNLKTSFSYNNGNPEIVMLPEMSFINDKEGKPVGIHKNIGRKPVLAVGNSDGDLQMLQWTASSNHKSLMVYVHHTDAEREWAYDRESHIGRLDKGLDEAKENGWTVIDMKKEWKIIYPFEKK